LESVEKQVAGLRYDHRLLFDILDRIEHKIDKPNNVNRTTLISSENQSLINQSFIKTPINTEDELEAVEAKLIDHEQNHEFRSQLVIVFFYLNSGNHKSAGTRGSHGKNFILRTHPPSTINYIIMIVDHFIIIYKTLF